MLRGTAPLHPLPRAHVHNGHNVFLQMYVITSRHADRVMQVNKYRSPRAKRKRTVNANKTVVEGIDAYLPNNRQELTPRARCS